MTRRRATMTWYGPTLLHHHRVLAIRRISRDLVRRAGHRPHYDPETWLDVAEELGLEIHPHQGLINGVSHARVRWDLRADCWVLEYDVTRMNRTQCKTIVHELAHVYQRREESGLLLCDEPTIYCYEAPIWQEQHKIARAVERRVMG